MVQAIVTGANGFMGSVLVNYLAEKGVQVFAMVRGTDPIIRITGDKKNVHPFDCDLAKAYLIPEILKTLPAYDSTKPTVFYHLAWVGSSGRDRGDYQVQAPNIANSINCADVAAQLEVVRFVSVGSIAEKVVEHMDFTDGIAVHSVYALTKEYVHKLLHVHCAGRGLDAVWCQVSNTYGPGDMSGNIVNYTIQTLLAGETPEYASGDQPCNMLHVRDFAQALFLIGQAKKTVSKVYFIGGPEISTVRDMMEMTRDAVKPGAALGFGQREDDHIRYRAEWLDISPLEKEFQYRPIYAFAQGIQETVAWILKDEGLHDGT